VLSHLYKYEYGYLCTSSWKHKIQCNPLAPFTLVRVVYESELPVNPTRTGPVCMGPVFRQLIQVDVYTINKNGDEIDV